MPISTAEQVESTHAAFEAGASLVHIHVRDEQENSSSDPQRFALVQEGIKKHCPGIIIQFSTGGRGREADQRGSMLYLAPDMASLATGSVNFPGMIYENHPELIDQLAGNMLKHHIKPEVEVFDLSMLYSAATLVERSLIKAPVHVQFVMGVPNALPPRREILEFELAQLSTVLPDATWTAAGVGRGQLEVNHRALEMGGHCRTGLEDNLRFDKSRLAQSNAELVERVAILCSDYDRHPASTAEARQILGLQS